MLAAPVVAPEDKVTQLASEKIWLPAGEWIEWPTGKRLDGPAQADRSFSIDQIPIYLKAGAIVPMQPPMLYTGEKPVDPLIVNVWPLAPGENSSYSVYEDSGVSVEYKRGAFVRTPIKAAQTGDTLRVEIGPAQGSYPGMLKKRSYELRLPADWPPSAVTVNGAPVKQAGPNGKNGWSFVGNTLTTVIPVSRAGIEAKVTIEVRRARGLTARRSELDGFAGSMTRLRAAYDALQQTWPVAAPPDPLIDAMQSGDRLGYHPERAVEEIAHFREVLPMAQAAVAAVGTNFEQRTNDYAKRMESNSLRPANMDEQKQARLHAMQRAEAMVKAAGSR
jgi:alpha-glucosidase